jgi:peroxiredoxin
MKKVFLLFILVLSVNFLFSQEAPEGLFLNSKAPDFKGKDQHGNDVRLKDILKKGRVILVFYQGEWSPYCNKYLQKLEDSLQLIKDKGATVIAVTPEQPESIAKTIEKTKAEYSILHDAEIKIMKGYEVEFEVPENSLKRYRNGGIKLDEVNGKNGNYLPVPATYIIDKEGYITYRFFNQDNKKRPSVKEILDNLK